jgi:hypothetical protein
MSFTSLEALQELNAKIDALSDSKELLDEAIHRNEFAKADLISLLDKTATRVTSEGLGCPSFDKHISEIICAVRNK